jgi:hypothetical protein
VLDYDAALDVPVPLTLAPGFGVRRELSVSAGEFRFRVSRERPVDPSLEGYHVFDIEFESQPEISFTVDSVTITSAASDSFAHAISELPDGRAVLTNAWYTSRLQEVPRYDNFVALSTLNRDESDTSRFVLRSADRATPDAWLQHVVALNEVDAVVTHPADDTPSGRISLGCNPDIFSQRFRYDIRTARGDVEFIIAMENDGGPSPLGWLTTTRPLAVQGQLDGLAFQVDDVDDLFFAPRYDPFFSDYIFPLLAVRFTAPIDGICGLYFGSNGGDPLGDRGYVAFELSCDDLAPVNPFDVTDFYGDYADP